MMGGTCVISNREDGSVYVLQSAFQLSKDVIVILG